MRAKALIFDSSSIITLSLNNLLSLLVALKRKFKGGFFITPTVKQEVVDTPLNIKRFGLEALMISSMLKNKILELPPLDMNNETETIFERANHIFKADDEWIKIMHHGEASCLALYNLLRDRGYKVALVIDERTTRMLCENPRNLQKLLEKKLHRKVITKDENLQSFKDFNIIRSTELCFVAYKKNLIKLPVSADKAIDALLYAAKYKGCAISSAEIEQAKKLI